MKSLLLIAALFISFQSFGQIATAFEDAQKMGISVPHLDSTYKSAMHSDETLAAFPGRGEEVYQNYIKLLQDFGKYLSKNNFKWEATTHSFNRIYFRADGHIDYFLYNFRGALSGEREVKFKKLLNEFIRDYQFGMHGNVKFAQCSPVTYEP